MHALEKHALEHDSEKKIAFVLYGIQWIFISVHEKCFGKQYKNLQFQNLQVCQDFDGFLLYAKMASNFTKFENFSFKVSRVFFNLTMHMTNMT